MEEKVEIENSYFIKMLVLLRGDISFVSLMHKSRRHPGKLVNLGIFILDF